MPKSWNIKFYFSLIYFMFCKGERRISWTNCVKCIKDKSSSLKVEANRRTHSTSQLISFIWPSDHRFMRVVWVLLCVSVCRLGCVLCACLLYIIFFLCLYISLPDEGYYQSGRFQFEIDVPEAYNMVVSYYPMCMCFLPVWICDCLFIASIKH